MSIWPGGPYTPLRSDCYEWSLKHQRCSRGNSNCPCLLFIGRRGLEADGVKLNYAAAAADGRLREWLDRFVEVQRSDGMFEPDTANQETDVEKSSDRKAA